MKSLKILPLIAFALLTFNSCSNDDDGPNLVPIEAELVSNLFAPQDGGFAPGQQPPSGSFTKFDFATGATTTSDTEWDIAFRGTDVIVNGGVSQGVTDEPERNGNAAAYIALDTFDSVTEINTGSFVQDSQAILAIPSGSDNGWYNYSGFGNANPANDNLITPLPGRILVFRTRDGKYAKVDVLSYYQDSPSNPNGFTDAARYYTFNYVYQPNEGVTTFE